MRASLYIIATSERDGVLCGPGGAGGGGGHISHDSHRKIPFRTYDPMKDVSPVFIILPHAKEIDSRWPVYRPIPSVPRTLQFRVLAPRVKLNTLIQL